VLRLARDDPPDLVGDDRWSEGDAVAVDTVAVLASALGAVPWGAEAIAKASERFTRRPRSEAHPLPGPRRHLRRFVYHVMLDLVGDGEGTVVGLRRVSSGRHARQPLCDAPRHAASARRAGSGCGVNSQSCTLLAASRRRSRQESSRGCASDRCRGPTRGSALSARVRTN
jgi:hypothetical protein